MNAFVSRDELPKRRHKKKRQDGKPKRPLSAYNFFFRDEREILVSQTQQQQQKESRYRHGNQQLQGQDTSSSGYSQEEQQNMNHDSTTSSSNDSSMSFQAMTKIIGERWKKLNDPELKLKYIQMAKRDSERYAQEMKQFNDNIQRRSLPSSTSTAATQNNFDPLSFIHTANKKCHPSPWATTNISPHATISPTSPKFDSIMKSIVPFHDTSSSSSNTTTTASNTATIPVNNNSISSNNTCWNMNHLSNTNTNLNPIFQPSYQHFRQMHRYSNIDTNSSIFDMASRFPEHDGTSTSMSDNNISPGAGSSNSYSGTVSSQSSRLITSVSNYHQQQSYPNYYNLQASSRGVAEPINQNMVFFNEYADTSQKISQLLAIVPQNEEERQLLIMQLLHQYHITKSKERDIESQLLFAMMNR